MPPPGLFKFWSMYLLDYVGPARAHIICQIAPETLSECPKFSWGDFPQTPLVPPLCAHTRVGLTTQKLLAPALIKGKRFNNWPQIRLSEVTCCTKIFRTHYTLHYVVPISALRRIKPLHKWKKSILQNEGGYRDGLKHPKGRNKESLYSKATWHHPYIFVRYL